MPRKGVGCVASDPEKFQGAPYYDVVVLKQEQELELRENVAYAPVR